MKNYIVYKHTFPNGKVYIGITKMSPKQRWGNQGKGYYHNKEMWEAIKNMAGIIFIMKFYMKI